MTWNPYSTAHIFFSSKHLNLRNLCFSSLRKKSYRHVSNLGPASKLISFFFVQSHFARIHSTLHPFKRPKSKTTTEQQSKILRASTNIFENLFVRLEGHSNFDQITFASWLFFEYINRIFLIMCRLAEISEELISTRMNVKKGKNKVDFIYTKNALPNNESWLVSNYFKHILINRYLGSRRDTSFTKTKNY
jgi:hypothetical protein